MTTKTITIMEDAYTLLLKNKVENESFSEEIRRIFTQKKKKNLMDFFGLLSDEEGKDMLKDLERIKSMNIKQLKEKLK